MILRDYQRRCVDDLFGYFNYNDGSPICILPTAAGKSVILATFTKEACEQYPGTRIMVLTHVAKLLKQNCEKLISVWPDAPADFYSASVGRKNHKAQIIFAGIQSVYKQAFKIQGIDVILIDECHLLSPKETTRYRKFLADMKIINPHIKIAGFTASPWRLDSGMIYGQPDSLFTDCCHETTIPELLEQGYLCPITTRKTGQELDTSGVHVRGGEFVASELASAVDKDEVTRACVDEIVALDMRPGLCFATGVKHAYHIRDEIRSRGFSCEVIDGETAEMARDVWIDRMVRGDLDYLSNCGTLTTGVDIPPLRMIADLAPTKSPALHCLDTQTEILTQRGWLGVGDVVVGDIAASIANDETGEGEWSPITGFIERPMMANEHWVEYEGPRSNIRVTDGHTMIYATNTFSQGKSWRRSTAKKMAQYRNPVMVRGAVLIERKGVGLSEWELYFIGMMMADGTWSTKTRQGSIVQSERHPEIISKIEKCLGNLGIAYRKNAVKHDGVMVERHKRWRYDFSIGMPRAPTRARGGVRGFEYLLPYMDKGLHIALMQVSAQEAQWLWNGLWDGDGFKNKCPSIDWIPRSQTLLTNRKTVADRLQAIFAISGRDTNVRKERDRDMWKITLSPKSERSFGNASDGRPRITVSGRTDENVWCVETEAGTIVTRRQGKVTVMGNCQKLGRLMRLSPGKDRGIVLDFARNVDLHGPLDLIKPKPKGAKGEGEAPIKVCEECGAKVHPSVRECPDCGFLFPPPSVTFQATAGKGAILSTQIEPTWLTVNDASYAIHRKAGKPDSLKVTYRCGLVFHSEWVTLSHEGYARRKAEAWWMSRACNPLPANTGLAYERRHEIRCPTAIRVRKNGKYVEIVGADFEPRRDVA